LGCWVVGLLGCWVVGLLGCWVVGLLGCWVVGLLGCWVVGGEKSDVFFWRNKNWFIFALLNRAAEIAQLVEHDLAKVGVAGSSPVFRSEKKHPGHGIFFHLDLPVYVPGWRNW
jgi:hypothetical protein